ncbi:hypothetical protein LVY72_15355 [Arthrobacter sp. I2-34]|uniref:Uncharacterized protein n=1 Tax=Arthrobacter hankyongi TaxID=2904801 RepID=A0ABS9L9D6_9MICC|nr:hypothetical protein [Arthrobacter hankyongi]MCG2623275.1 hypothetical protein [Arthrobacter hankyongi]
MERVPRGCAGRLDDGDAESIAARAILDRLQALEPLCARNTEADDFEPGSPLARLDERFAASHSVSSLLQQSLAAAMDNLQALRRLLFAEEPGGSGCYRLYTNAPYSLVRTVIECAATVLWALLPEHGRERARRSLVLIAREVFNAASFWDTYLEEFHPGQHAGARDYFDGLRRSVNESAQAMGLPPIFSRKADGNWGYATKNRTQTAILKDLRSAGDVPAELVYVWQFCSGYSHGLEWASANGGSYPDPFSGPGREQAPAGSMEQLRRMCDAAFDLVPRAWAIYDMRRRAWPLL